MHHVTVIIEWVGMKAIDSENAEMKLFFSGERLYGDDFSQELIDEWFADEGDGYFNLTRSSGVYAYGYHALNQHHGYSYLPKKRFGCVLGVGAAYGEELEPILQFSNQIFILEPSDGFGKTELKGVPISYRKPLATGDIEFDADTFDLITCFGVLHHIPNVSKVVKEFYRVLKPGGYVLLREPIHSMGDWRKFRRGLTKRERGIPIQLLREFIRTSGFRVIRENKCMFSLVSRLQRFVQGSVWNNQSIVKFDLWLSKLAFWPDDYHARNTLQKIRPTSVFYVLEKPCEKA